MSGLATYRNRYLTAATVAACLTLTACSGTGDEPGADTPAPATIATGLTTAASATTAVRESATTSNVTSTILPGPIPDPADPAAEVVAAAVDAFVAAGSYAFDATVTIVVAGQPTEIELGGWIDNSDRELVVRSGDNEVITRVIDGVATVERDGTVTEVPLEEAGEAPSIEILKSIQTAAHISDTEVAGKLAATDLKASGFDLDGSADVTIYLTAELTLAAYTMTADNGIWIVEVRFFDNAETRERLAAFIAALEDVLVDTRYAGQALNEPELFIATGRLLCEELSTGTTPDQLLTRYVEALTGGDINSADDDDLVLAGALLGVSVGSLCPEHTSTLDPKS